MQKPAVSAETFPSPGARTGDTGHEVPLCGQDVPSRDLGRGGMMGWLCGLECGAAARPLELLCRNYSNITVSLPTTLPFELYHMMALTGSMY